VGLLLCFREGGEQHRGQDSDDGNDYEQLDQRKRRPASIGPPARELNKRRFHLAKNTGARAEFQSNSQGSLLL
jgi:hypothetical protein